MTDEVKKYFFEQYSKLKIRVVPGHWPDFETKKEVDEWLGELERFANVLFKKKKGGR